MKKLFIFLGIIIVVILILNVALFIFINTKGKDVIAENIERSLGVDVSIDSLSFKFPFTVEIKNFKCADISFKKADIFLGMIDPFGYRIILNKVSIDELKAKVIKNEEGIVIIPPSPKDVSSGVPKESQEVKKIPSKDDEPQKKLAITFKNLHIKNSQVEFIDLTADKPFSIILDSLDIRLRGLSFPQLTKFHIRLESSVKTQKGLCQDAIVANGWADYFRKNMDVDVNINAVNYTFFSDLYPPFWKPDNLGINEAFLSLKANLNSKDNDLLINSNIALDEINFTQGLEDTSNQDLIKTILAFLKGDKEKASLNLKLKTKMDSPKLDFSSIKGSFQDALPMGQLLVGGVIGKTKETVSERVGDVKEMTVDKSIDTIKKTIDTIKGIFVPSDNTQE